MNATIGQNEITGSSQLRGGNLYLSAETHQRLLRGKQTVILLRDGADLQILPVAHAAAGGYLIKLRNRAGDRVIDAAEFFRGQGREDDTETQLTLTWCDARGAAVSKGFFEEKV